MSVVIPAYNAERWLAETLRSVFAQTISGVEIIVVDDGSTDGTAMIAGGFPGVQVIHQVNGGEASARNTGIRAARGQYVAFVDADDLWMPEKLLLQIALLQSTGLAWAYSDAYAFQDENGRILYRFSRFRRFHEGDILEKLLLENFIPMPTPLIHRDVFNVVGLFDESLVNDSPYRAVDWDLWLRIAARYPVGLIRQPLASYRVHQSSMLRSISAEQTLASQKQVIDRAIRREPERLHRLRNLALAAVYTAAGRTLTSQGNPDLAGQMFRQALRLAPTCIEPYLYWFACGAGRPFLKSAIRVRHWLRSIQ